MGDRKGWRKQKRKERCCLNWNLQTLKMKRKKRLTLGSCDNKSNGGLKIYGDLRIVSRTRWLNIKVAEGKLQLNTRAKLE